MQYSKLALLAVLATPFAAAQSLSDLPTCAQQAATSSISTTGCALTDIKCICSASSYLSSLQQAVTKVCSPADQAKAIAFAQQVCGSAGITINPSAASGSATAASSAAASSYAASSYAASSYAASSAPASTMMTSTVAVSSAAVVSAISDGQPQAPTSVVAVSQISDGQPQAASATAAAVSQLSDGQPQAPTSVVAVSQISDGQPQAATATASAVSQRTDGQPLVPTAAPVSNGTSSSNVTATSSPPPVFTGAASSFGIQWIAVAAVGAAGVFFAGL